MKRWNDSYDQLLSDIDFNLDRPLLWFSERVSVRDFNGSPNADGSKNTNGSIKCEKVLFSELKRQHLNIYSRKIQFAAINYCFSQSTLPFDFESDSAIACKNYVIPKAEKTIAAQANEDVRSMSNEFRCYAQHRIAVFEEQKRKSIFKLSAWVVDKLSRLFVRPVDATAASRKQALEECDFSAPAKDKARYSS
jgi:hypothetical protein